MNINKKNIITITGSLGSGKSSTAKLVANKLGYKHISGGDFMRALAKDRGISLEELSKIAETDTSIDEALDNQNIEIGKQNNVVIDSRLGFHFIPNSFKILLELDPVLAAKRILHDLKFNPDRRNEAKDYFNSEESIVHSIDERLLSERKRYKELYNINNHRAHENFDIIINTAAIPLEDVVNLIINEYKKWLLQ